MGEAMNERDPKMVWLDLEMTGLDVDRCAIIEIGLVITGKDLEPLAELERVIWQPEEVLLRMTPFVREFHKTSASLGDSTASGVLPSPSSTRAADATAPTP